MWPNPQETPDLVTFNEEILNRKLHFLCSVLILSFTIFEELSLAQRFFKLSKKATF